jgi:hypothetical protein
MTVSDSWVSPKYPKRPIVSPIFTRSDLPLGAQCSLGRAPGGQRRPSLQAVFAFQGLPTSLPSEMTNNAPTPVSAIFWMAS